MKMQRCKFEKEFGSSSNHVIYFRQWYWNPLRFINKKEESFTIHDVEVNYITFSLSKIFNKYRIEFLINFEDKYLRLRKYAEE